MSTTLPSPTLFRRGVDERASLGLFVLALLEVHDRDVVGLGVGVEVFHVGVADLVTRCRGRDREALLPAEERADLAHCLELWHVALEEEAIDAAAGERHVIAQ
jgi:hypothetical protein